MRIVIAGGGTGGHLFPGIAIAEEFLKRDDRTQIIFIGTKRGIESRLLGQLGYELREIDIEGVKGRGIKALVKVVYQIPKSMGQSRRILKQFRPDMVIGVGGYASGPALLMAHWMGLPTAIAEQNAIPGVTNKILGKFADKIFVTYEQTRTFFPEAKVVFSGNPVRASFASRKLKEKPESTYRQLLIFGGSQGAEAINKSVIEMLPQLSGIKDKIRILHQTGERQLEEVKKAYGQFGIQADVKSFIMEMAQAYANSDLIICRAGATSLAEITAAGKAAVLIPYPWAANDHQLKNARALEAEGAAAVIEERELSGARLFGVVENLLRDERKLKRMEENSLRISKINAAATIVDACICLMTEKKSYH
ncbi:MAG TPA: undecaprenyldiphospho-muramoylpentapeptide beta-N-acetylglucosaminyltransferase [Smithella sp.]|nr:undecaprenyldiphospho-muramoylpentapeptide beta-N-acetylglucosaminyltransferase [Smithella sp.]HNY49569.1 undecaprenyldiphospho-muramoylpentapeptide beta-N-acetylglucosaminyltransferase [Smithella sp.]HOG89342.1 undecaprenyldiphospho-muramoylpentapeptide beta-N-acetylglucosaminyltransferase [Smithella sp.]HOU50124.1 undecaprenyldiphospho-muramoylpentapeptide beta-N-acetylglucosaminyltransferase [Smithella sp.]HQG64706.1 undecaprenyldiphospho-muramoylpentapeptide beta-N-acetylglucosaminyltran